MTYKDATKDGATHLMNRLHVWVPILLMASIWCVASSGSDGQGVDLNSVLKRFRGFRLLTLQERDPDVTAFLCPTLSKEQSECRSG
jgi:hypothetical protein